MSDSKNDGCITLANTGSKMPLVGFGTWKIPKDVTASQVENAIKTGYRHLDCACDYGNEEQVGAGIKAAIASGIVKREDLWITSKLWNTYHEKQHVMPAFQKSLKDLGLEYLDLYLIHFPISLKYVPFETRYPPEWDHDPKVGGLEHSDATIRETWEGMQEIFKAGLAKNIGVCNFSCALLADLFKWAEVKPNVLQIEHHPYLQQPALIDFAKKKGMAVTAFSSLGTPSYIDLFDWVKDLQPLLTHEVITKIATAHKKTPAQVLLRWATQREIIIIPKSSNQGRLQENLDVNTFTISEEEMKSIATLDKHLRFNDPKAFCGFPIYD